MFECIQKSVKLSDPIYAHSRPFMIFFRLLGLFPFVVHQNSQKFLKWSPWLSVYGFALGFFIVFMTCWQMGHPPSDYPPLSPVDVMIIYAIMSCWLAFIFCGYFIQASQVQTFLSYVKLINEVDDVIKIKYSQSERWLKIVLVATSLAWGVHQFAQKIQENFQRGSTFSNFVNHGSVSFSLWFFNAVVANTVRCLIWSFEKRLGRLGEVLQLANYRIQAQSRPFLRRRLHEIKEKTSNDLEKLTEVYSKLCDAVNCLNQLLGATMALALLIGFLPVIATLFFIFEDVRERGFANIWDMVPTFTAFFIPVPLIIEASHACNLQFRNVEKCVSRLLTWNFGPAYTKQVKRMAIIVGLRQIEFSACKLFVIKRGLYTSTAGTMITLLTYLLEIEDAHHKSLQVGQ